MDPPKCEGKQCPSPRAGWLSSLLFLWPKPLIERGWRRPLNNEDMYHMLPEDSPQQNVPLLQKEWEKELVKHKEGGTPSFWFALCRSVAPFYMKIGIISFLEIVSRLAQPVLFSYLMTYFSADGGGISEHQAWWCVVGIIFFCLLHVVTGPHIVYNYLRTVLKFQGATTGLLYRKLLRLSHAALRGYTRGQILDYITNDAFRPRDMVWFMHDIWMSPLCAMFSLYVMYIYIGMVAVFGMLVGLASIPISVYIGNKVAGYREKQCVVTDKRVGVITELVSAMRLIKMYCWEKPFSDKVATIRREELRYTWLDALWASMLVEFSFFISRVILAAIIIFYAASGQTLSATTMFPVLTFFSVMQESFLTAAPWGYKEWKAVKVSLNRIQDLLLAEELPTPPPTGNEAVKVGKSGILAQMTNVSAKWEKSCSRLTLSDISCIFRQAELVTIIGPVGSGKSSLLMALMGELPVTGGHVTTSGQLSYASQQAWVFSSSLRQNILMGEEMEPDRYNQILRATALDKDLESFLHGDLTLVGERGVTLSGGQKARVNLARALYRHADIYLLDDPLSAVDTKVGKHIFNRCITGLLKDKLCILVTHQLQYLRESGQIILLKEGRIEAHGNYEELLTSGVDFAKLLSKQMGHNRKAENMVKQASRQESLGEELLDHTKGLVADWEDEDREKGRVKLDVFLQFFRHGGSALTLAALVLLFVASQLFYNLSDWWIAQWSSSEDLASNHPPDSAGVPQRLSGELSLSWKLGVYLVISAALVILGVTRIIMYYWVCLRAARKLHDNMFSSVMRSPIHFFDTTPTGRLVNRFASAIDSVDHDLPRISQDFLKYLSLVVGSALMIVMYAPLVLLPTLPLLAGLIYSHRKFLSSQREVNRIESLRRSPYVNHVYSTLEGVETLRALQLQDRCIRDFEEQTRLMMSPWFTDNCIYGWLHIRMNAVASLFVTFTVLGCMIAAKSLRAEDVGLVMVNAVPLMWFLGEVTRLGGDTETSFVQAERVVAYTNLPSEAPLESVLKPKKTWPQEGAIDFCDVSFQYNEKSPTILHHLTFSVKGGEKVGIVGRTGAGKSSLVQALFRLAEPQGHILIDGVDISKLGLHDLRSNISIIPQDPVMFGGTVRQNLDPFDQHSDNELWRCLEEVHLKQMIWQLADGLESLVSEGGSNFSLGERQLFCLARALLKDTKILVLDEATANVDHRTDEWIQDTIRKRFKYCTVLTIAHRLNTVMQAGRIMVLEKGRVEEFDCPSALLKDRQGLLYRLVEQTGPEEQRRLLQLAHQSNDLPA